MPDATAIAEAVAAGRTSARQVLETHLNRMDRTEPQVNGAVQVFREAALQTAEAGPTGPLAGVPISVKETLAIAGEPVTAGSRRYPAYRPDADARVIQRLKDAGAIVLARGNLPECAMTHEAANLVYGETRNPLHLGRSPGGSSGGDAALVGAGSVAAAVGSDIGGSIRYPAHCCGIVGFKPASGVLPIDGSWPPPSPNRPTFYADSFLALGPLTRSVRDARRLTHVMAGTEPAPLPDAKTVRMLVPESFAMDVRAPMARAWHAAGPALAAEGGSVAFPAVPNAAQVYRDYLTVLLSDYGDFFVDVLTTAAGERLSFAREAMRHLQGRPTVHRYYFRLLCGMQLMRPTEAAAERAAARLERARVQIREVLSRGSVLLLPTNGALAMRPGEASAYMARPGVRRLFTPTIYANALDLPALSVPCPRYRDPATGLVPGLQLLSAPGDEAALFAAGTVLERKMAGIGE